mgnify:FL=1
MTIQIFGKKKCFDTKKAERFFKERGVKYQRVDILDKGLSKGELRSVVSSVGSLEALLDEEAKEYAMIKYLVASQREEKLLDTPSVYKTPIVRNGKKATIGYAPETWKAWLASS